MKFPQFLIIGTFLFLIRCIDGEDSVDAILTVPQLIEKYEYPFEHHFVETEDRYILALHRIPDGKVSVPRRGPPLLLIHSLWSSSAEFVIQGPNKSLAYMLADEGYDVWLGNTRGGTYSSNHSVFNPRVQFQNKFWDYSFHEKGAYDLPAMMDYILDETAESQVIIIGVSEGSTAFFAMGSERPEYLAKVQAHICYAPAVFIYRTTFLLSRILTLLDTFEFGRLITRFIGHFNIAPDCLIMHLLRWFCRTSAVTSLICNTVISPVLDSQPGEISESLVNIILGHLPTSTSTKQLLHFSQNIRFMSFAKYRRRFVSRLESYNLSNITTPLYVFYSRGDHQVNYRDVELLESKLPYAFMRKVLLEHFGHSDFVLSKNAKDLVFSETVDILASIT